MVFLLLKRLMYSQVRGLRTRFLQWTRPFTSSLPLQTLADLGRSKSELVTENALLRHQLIILKRQVKRPACTKADRLLLVLLARVVRPWKQALFIVQPETRLALASGALPVLATWSICSKSRKGTSLQEPYDHLAGELIAKKRNGENYLWTF
jgi:hypothetical protein